jgi:hypothetical protein
MREQED